MEDLLNSRHLTSGIAPRLPLPVLSVWSELRRTPNLRGSMPGFGGSYTINFTSSQALYQSRSCGSYICLGLSWWICRSAEQSPVLYLAKTALPCRLPCMGGWVQESHMPMNGIHCDTCYLATKVRPLHCRADWGTQGLSTTPRVLLGVQGGWDG